MQQRIGRWMPTISGEPFYPLDPCLDDIRLNDIAHALALENRFGGHTRKPYCVAQHSVLVSLYLQHTGADAYTQMWGLLHDAAEAYIKDIPSPLKEGLQEYRELEQRWERMISMRFFGAVLPIPSSVVHADAVLLATERRDLFADQYPQWQPKEESAEFEIKYWSWNKAEEEFHIQFKRLVSEGGLKCAST